MIKKNYQTEIKDLKKIISNLNYGIKTENGIRPSATKISLEKNFRKPITNKLIRDHWNNKQTLYFYGNENINEKCLLMIDIDVDKKNKKGSTQGAINFAEHLKSIIQDFYYEISTNGKGVHGYLIIDKCEKNSIESNKIFKKFENFLIKEKEKINADIELVEVKGTLHEINYKENKITHIKFGTLGKIPKNINEFFKFKNKEIKITDIQKKYNIEKAKKINNNIEVGSISKKLINKKDLEKLEVLEEISKNIFGDKIFKKNKFKITHKDIAITLLLLIFFKENKNEDKTLPTKRAMMLWKALYDCGDISRAWNHHRWKYIRDLLSEKDLIYWIDNSYTYGNKSINQKGIACKWEIRKKLYMYLKVYLKESKRKKRASLMDTKSVEKIKILNIRQIKSLISYRIPVLYTLITRAKEFLILNKANEYIKNSFCYT